MRGGEGLLNVEGTFEFAVADDEFDEPFAGEGADYWISIPVRITSVRTYSLDDM